MADKNREEVSSAIQAVAAVVGETSYKDTLDSNFAQSVVFKKDVSGSGTGSGAQAIDFDLKDYIAFNATGGAAITLNNINQGNIKFLKITKNATDVITWANATLETANIDYITSLAAVLFQIFNKDGTLQVVPLTNMIPYASEANKGIVEKATTAENEAGTPDKYVDAALLQALTSTEERKGVIERPSKAEAEGLSDNERAMTPLRTSQQTEFKFENWQSVAYDAGDFTGWTPSNAEFSVEYLKIGKTVFLNITLDGNIPVSTDDVYYNGLPASLFQNEISSLNVLALHSLIPRTIAGASILNGNIRISQDGDFTSGNWLIYITGTYQSLN